MAYVVIKTIKGRQYRYLQCSWREGKKVRTQAICLGPVGGVARKRKVSRVPACNSSLDQDERYNREMSRLYRESIELDEWQRQTFGETAAERRVRQQREKLDGLYEAYGLRVPSENSMPQAGQAGAATTK